MAYRVALPPELAGVHDVFHVSQHRQYVHDLAHVINYRLQDLREDLSYDEYLWKIPAREEFEEPLYPVRKGAVG